MSHEKILKYNSKRAAASKKVRRKRDKVNSLNKQINEEQSQKIKLPEPIIYDPSDNSRNQQRNLPLAADDSNNILDQQRQKTITDAKEIIDYYLTFHKNMLNIYNSLYSQILQDIFNSYNNNFSTVNERIINYSTQIENMYNSLTSERDKSLKLVDNIITENLDTYIKSIKLAQKFYKDVIESYLNCINK